MVSAREPSSTGEVEDYHSSPTIGSEKPKVKERNSKRRASKEYYDILSVASHRLKKDEVSALTGSNLSDDGEVIKPKKSKKSKKSKKKSKKERKSKRKDRGSDEKEEDEGQRTSSVFQSPFPQSMLESWRSAKQGYTSAFNDGDSDAALGMSHEEKDPNDETPKLSGLRNPAALVTAAQSKSGKTDESGYYKQVKGNRATRTSTTTGIFRGLISQFSGSDDMPSDFNLHSIGKSSHKPKRKVKPQKQKSNKYLRNDSIVWGDECTMLGVENETDRVVAGSIQENDVDDEEEGIEFTDDCSYSNIDEAAEAYYAANKELMDKIIWQRDRKRLGLLFVVGVVISSVGFGFYFSGGKKTAAANDGPPPYTFIPTNVNSTLKRDAPKRPVPSAPLPLDFGVLTDDFDETATHTMTQSDIISVINRITSDASVLSDPRSPQSR